MPRLLRLLMPGIWLLVLPLGLSAQSSNDAEFRARVRALRIAEKVLKEGGPDPELARSETAARRLRDFRKNAAEFGELSRDLLGFATKDGPSANDLREVRRKVKDLEKRADRLLSYIGGEPDGSAEPPETATSTSTLYALSTILAVRIHPNLVRVLETAAEGVIDVRVQQALVEDLHVVKVLGRRLRDR